MKRQLLVGALGALLTTIPVASAASSTNLSSKLLTISQMPTGWRVDNSASGGGVGCLANSLEPKGITQTANAVISFQESGGYPALEEKVATFTNVKTGYQKIVSNLNACKHFSGTDGGTKVSYTVGQLSFPHYGDASAAWAVSFNLSGTSLAEDVLVIRKGNIVMGINEADLDGVDTSQFKGFATKAVAKL